MLSEVTKHQLPWVTTAFPLHAEHEEFQCFHNSPATKAQRTPDADVWFTKGRKAKWSFMLQCVFILIFSLSVLAGSSASPQTRQTRGSQWTLQNVKNPHKFSMNLESRGLSHYFGSRIPLCVCLKYSSARIFPPGKNLTLLHLQALFTLVGRDITRLNWRRAFKSPQKEKRCVTEEETEMLQKIYFMIWIII